MNVFLRSLLYKVKTDATISTDLGESLRLLSVILPFEARKSLLEWQRVDILHSIGLLAILSHRLCLIDKENANICKELALEIAGDSVRYSDIVSSNYYSTNELEAISSIIIVDNKTIFNGRIHSASNPFGDKVKSLDFCVK